MFWNKKKKKQPKEGDVVAVHMNIFDEEEIIENCTVQVLRNSVTGEMSIGFWPSDQPPAVLDEEVEE